MVVLPLTFNTANKAASGIADTPAAALLCEAIGGGIPVIAAAMLKTSLANHPVWDKTVRLLSKQANWYWLDLTDGSLATAPKPIETGQGDLLTDDFDPKWVTAAVQRILQGT